MFLGVLILASKTFHLISIEPIACGFLLLCCSIFAVRRLTAHRETTSTCGFLVLPQVSKGDHNCFCSWSRQRFQLPYLQILRNLSRTLKVLSILISCLVGLVFTVEHYKIVEITKSKTNTVPLWSLIFLFMTCFIEILLLCSSCSAILRLFLNSFRKLRKPDIQIL